MAAKEAAESAVLFTAGEVLQGPGHVHEEMPIS